MKNLHALFFALLLLAPAAFAAPTAKGPQPPVPQVEVDFGPLKECLTNGFDAVLECLEEIKADGISVAVTNDPLLVELAEEACDKLNELIDGVTEVATNTTELVDCLTAIKVINEEGFDELCDKFDALLEVFDEPIEVEVVGEVATSDTNALACLEDIKDALGDLEVTIANDPLNVADTNALACLEDVKDALADLSEALDGPLAVTGNVGIVGTVTTVYDGVQTVVVTQAEGECLLVTNKGVTAVTGEVSIVGTALVEIVGQPLAVTGKVEVCADDPLPITGTVSLAGDTAISITNCVAVSNKFPITIGGTVDVNIVNQPLAVTGEVAVAGTVTTVYDGVQTVVVTQAEGECLLVSNKVFRSIESWCSRTDTVRIDNHSVGEPRPVGPGIVAYPQDSHIGSYTLSNGQVISGVSVPATGGGTWGPWNTQHSTIISGLLGKPDIGRGVQGGDGQPQTTWGAFAQAECCPGDVTILAATLTVTGGRRDGRVVPLLVQIAPGDLIEYTKCTDHEGNVIWFSEGEVVEAPDPNCLFQGCNIPALPTHPEGLGCTVETIGPLCEFDDDGNEVTSGIFLDIEDCGGKRSFIFYTLDGDDPVEFEGDSANVRNCDGSTIDVPPEPPPEPIGVITHCFISPGEASGGGVEVKVATESSDCDPEGADTAVGATFCGAQIEVDTSANILSVDSIASSAGITFQNIAIKSGGMGFTAEACFIWDGSNVRNDLITATVTTDKGVLVINGGGDFKVCSGGGDTAVLLTEASSSGGEQIKVKELCYNGAPSSFQDAEGNAIDISKLEPCPNEIDKLDEILDAFEQANPICTNHCATYNFDGRIWGNPEAVFSFNPPGGGKAITHVGNGAGFLEAIAAAGCTGEVLTDNIADLVRVQICCEDGGEWQPIGFEGPFEGQSSPQDIVSEVKPCCCASDVPPAEPTDVSGVEELLEKLIDIKCDKAPVTHVLVQGTGNVPAGLKSVTINNISGITTINGVFQLGTGRRVDSISYNATESDCVTGLLPAYTLTGGARQWTGLQPVE